MDKFFVHFKSISDSGKQFNAIMPILYAINAKDAEEKAYAQLIGSPQGRNKIWKFDRIEFEEE